MQKLQLPGFYLAGLIFILMASGRQLAAQSWKLARDEDGIKVYTRYEAGKSLKSYRGVVEIKAPPEKVFALIENVYDHAWWGKDLKQVNVLLYEKNRRSRYYLEYRLPWPLSNRDLCVDVTVSADPAKKVFRTSAVHLAGIIPVYPDKVRMPDYNQSWTIIPSGPESASVVLEGYADPAGNIPDWIINMAIVDTPLNLLREIRHRLDKPH